MKLVVVTWNIHKGIGGVDRRYRLDRIIMLLSHHEPDFALLQEVDEDARRSNHHKQVDYLAEALGMSHRAYAVTHRLRTTGHYGNAILSRWPLHDEHHLDLTIGTRKSRGAVCARAQVRVGETARSIAIHNLHLGLAGTERELQLERFLGSHPFRGLQQRTPVLVGGDFNDLWGTLGSRFLEPAGFERVGPAASTFPAFLPVRPLDGLFVRGDAEVVSGHVSRHAFARVASDHLPLVGEIRLRR